MGILGRIRGWWRNKRQKRISAERVHAASCARLWAAAVDLRQATTTARIAAQRREIAAMDLQQANFAANSAARAAIDDLLERMQEPKRRHRK